MSNEDRNKPQGEKNPRMERIINLIEYQDLLIQSKDLIEDSLDEHLREHPRIVKQDELVSDLKHIFLANSEVSLTGEEIKDEIVFPLLNYVLNESEEEIRVLLEQNPKKELTYFLKKIGTKYKSEIRSVRFKDEQGPHFWNRIEAETTMRDSGFAGINYYLFIGDDYNGEEQELSVSFYSNINLTGRLLAALNEAAEQYPDEVHRQLDGKRLDLLEDEIESLREKLAGDEGT